MHSAQLEHPSIMEQPPSPHFLHSLVPRFVVSSTHLLEALEQFPGAPLSSCILQYSSGVIALAGKMKRQTSKAIKKLFLNIVFSFLLIQRLYRQKTIVLIQGKIN